jgi:hypothetical protein
MVACRPQILKSPLYIVTLYSKYSRALTFETVCQAKWVEDELKPKLARSLKSTFYIGFLYCTVY